MTKMKLSYRDRLNWVPSVLKTISDNDVTDLIDAVYAKNETKLLFSIRTGAVYDES